MKTKVTINISAEVEFETYSTEKLNKLAMQSIRGWLKESMDTARYIPLYVEQDDTGAYIEDCTKPLGKVKIALEEARYFSGREIKAQQPYFWRRDTSRAKLSKLPPLSSRTSR